MPPLYVAECEPCDRREDYFRKVAQRGDTPTCRCGRKMSKILTPTRVQTDIPEYVSPVSGRLIRGRRQRQYDLESSGCRPYEGLEQERKEADRRKAERAAKSEAKLDESIHQAITDLDASNRLTRKGGNDADPIDTSGMRVYG